VQEFVAGEALWRRVRDVMKAERAQKRAAIAYLGTDAADLLSGFGRGDVVVCDASPQAFFQGATHPEALATLTRRGVRVLSREGLHAKVLVLGRCAVVGSANASARSAGKLLEAAVVTDEPKLVENVISFIDDMTGLVTVTDEWIDMGRRRYRPPRIADAKRSTPPGERGGRPSTDTLWLLDYDPGDEPATVGRAVRGWRRSNRREIGPRTEHELDWSWEPRSNEPAERGDLVCWIDVEDGVVSPPARCLDTVPTSRHWLTFWMLPTAEWAPVAELRGHVLAYAGKRLRTGGRIRDARTVEAVLDFWALLEGTRGDGD
jgi:hypothetical protein